MLVWGRWRYDLIAFAALVIALILGVVPQDKAFSGFGHPATVIIALVLILSRGLSNSGGIEVLARYIVNTGRSLSAHIGIMSVVAAGLSALMNNVAALALLMPIDVQAAEKAKRSPALTLMPISFASILGGMVTLIGTPPNIVIASYREKALGEPFGMFDFTPVGAAVAVAGVIFIALIGWRLIPAGSDTKGPAEKLFEIDEYMAEVSVPEGSASIGKAVHELDDILDEHDVAILGLIRNNRRLPGFVRLQSIEAGDVLVLEAEAKAIDKVVGDLKLEYATLKREDKLLDGGNRAMMELVIPDGAVIVGRSVLHVQLLRRHGVTLLGVSRRGRRVRERVRRMPIQAGDVLLLFGTRERLAAAADLLGGLPLAERGLEVVNRRMAWLAVAIFSGAIGLATTGLVYLPVALALACVLMVMLNIVPIREVYTSIEWPVIVLLGSLIPIGAALEASGGTALLAQALVGMAVGAPAWVVLLLLMIVTMSLSDLLNNTATAVIAAPIAIDVANRLGANPDPFLMAVAVAASCAFLTPIGHKNNTLIMGPGGYKFGDYWRMGLPLELLVIVISVPAILFFWKF